MWLSPLSNGPPAVGGVSKVHRIQIVAATAAAAAAAAAVAVAAAPARVKSKLRKSAMRIYKAREEEGK